MKNEILKLLQSNKDYISGEDISKILNVSRSAIWKHIKTLKSEGFEIEGISNKGYKLLSCPDIIIENNIQKYLKTNFIAHTIYHYNTLNSTNTKAKELSDKANDGSIVISEIQEGAHGRFDRAWVSPKGGLWFSMILKPIIEPYKASKLTQIAAASIISVLKNKYNINAQIKWPNDLYINNKKFCGILTEMKCDLDRIDHIIIGIGINVNLTKDNFSDDLLDIATSLKIENDISYDRNELLAHILSEFEKLYLNYVNTNDFTPTLKICRENSIILKKDAYIVTLNKKEKVTCIDIDDDGNLIIQDKDGNIKSIFSGEVTFK